MGRGAWQEGNTVFLNQSDPEALFSREQLKACFEEPTLTKAAVRMCGSQTQERREAPTWIL